MRSPSTVDGGIGSRLAHWRVERPDRAAVLAYRSGGPSPWRETTWERMATMCAGWAGRANSEFERETVIVVMDGSAESFACALGMAIGGSDVILVESGSSYLTDPGAPIYVCRPACAFRADAPAGPVRAEPFDAPPATDADVATFLVDEPDREGRLLQLTSGSTGEPRVAAHPLSNIASGGRLYRDLFHRSSVTEIVLPISASHSFGLVGGLATSIVTGTRLRTIQPFNPGGVASALAEGPSMLLGTPLIYELISRAVPAGCRPDVAISSGGPLPAELAQRLFDERGWRPRQVFGTTETGLIASEPASGPRPTEDGHVGTLAPGATVELSPSDLTDRPGVGALAVRTATMLDCYVGQPSPLDGRGFYRTGDLASLEDDGLRLFGRVRTFINVGGRKVNPVRLERLMAELPEVTEVAVYAKPTSDGGEQVCAAVVLAAGMSEERLRQSISKMLSPYEIPRELRVVDRLPRSSMGKVDRGSLQR